MLRYLHFYSHPDELEFTALAFMVWRNAWIVIKDEKHHTTILALKKIYRDNGFDNSLFLTR